MGSNNKSKTRFGSKTIIILEGVIVPSLGAMSMLLSSAAGGQDLL